MKTGSKGEEDRGQMEREKGRKGGSVGLPEKTCLRIRRDRENIGRRDREDR